MWTVGQFTAAAPLESPRLNENTKAIGVQFRRKRKDEEERKQKYRGMFFMANFKSICLSF